MSKARINGIGIHYQMYGEGETVVFAHGAGGNLLSWWQQIPFFSQRYQCIAFDHRGFGHSLDEPEGPGSDAFVEDLAGLLDHLKVDKAHLNQYQGGICISGVLKTTERTLQHLILVLGPNWVPTDNAVWRYVHFTLALV